MDLTFINYLLIVNYIAFKKTKFVQNTKKILSTNKFFRNDYISSKWQNATRCWFRQVASERIYHRHCTRTFPISHFSSRFRRTPRLFLKRPCRADLKCAGKDETSPRSKARRSKHNFFISGSLSSVSRAVSVPSLGRSCSYQKELPPIRRETRHVSRARNIFCTWDSWINMRSWDTAKGETAKREIGWAKKPG